MIPELQNLRGRDSSFRVILYGRRRPEVEELRRQLEGLNSPRSREERKEKTKKLSSLCVSMFQTLALRLRIYSEFSDRLKTAALGQQQKTVGKIISWQNNFAIKLFCESTFRILF